MTSKEARDKFEKVLREVAQESGENLDIFISIVEKDGQGECLGFGCRGCHVENVILPMWERGFYSHNGHSDEDERIM